MSDERVHRFLFWCSLLFKCRRRSPLEFMRRTQAGGSYVCIAPAGHLCAKITAARVVFCPLTRIIFPRRPEGGFRPCLWTFNFASEGHVYIILASCSGRVGERGARYANAVNAALAFGGRVRINMAFSQASNLQTFVITGPTTCLCSIRGSDFSISLFFRKCYVSI